MALEVGRASDDRFERQEFKSHYFFGKRTVTKLFILGI